MRFKEITTDSEIILDTGSSELRWSNSTTVVISENSASAVVVIGFQGATGVFTPYTSGTLTTDAVVDHGADTILMVKITGISSGSVTVGWSK